MSPHRYSSLEPDPNRAQLYFPRSSQVMDSFECQPHPKGGNIIKMSKQA